MTKLIQLFQWYDDNVFWQVDGDDLMKYTTQFEKLYGKLIKLTDIGHLRCLVEARINQIISNKDRGWIASPSHIQDSSGIPFSIIHLLFQLRKSKDESTSILSSNTGINVDFGSILGNLAKGDPSINQLNKSSTKFRLYDENGLMFSNLNSSGELPTLQSIDLNAKPVDFPIVNKKNEHSHKLLHKTTSSLWKEHAMEEQLIRDLIFVLQGIDGTLIQFNSESDHYKLIKTSHVVSTSNEISAMRIAELGWLFKKIQAYIHATQPTLSTTTHHDGIHLSNIDISSSNLDIGLVEQAFREAISEEIQAYFRMITVLESQINTSIKCQSDTDWITHNNAKESRHEMGEKMTLIKLMVWTDVAFRRLKWIASAIDHDLSIHEIAFRWSNQGSKPEIDVSHSINDHIESGSMRMWQAHLLQRHGIPYAQSLGKTIEIYTSRPILIMIQNWIFRGLLDDPYKEFFIVENRALRKMNSNGDRKGGNLSYSGRHYGRMMHQPTWLSHSISPFPPLWEEQYRLVNARIPPFMSKEMALTILVVGKSINFMKNWCDDTAWIAETTRDVLELLVSKDDQGKPKTYQWMHLAQAIGKFSKLINKRLIWLIVEKFNLLEHLHAIRNYLFLGQGDLIESLVDGLQSELNLPPGRQSRHIFLSIIDDALRASVANTWPDYIQERCDVLIPTNDLFAAMQTNSLLAKKHRPWLSSSTQLLRDGWDTVELFYQLSPPLELIIGTEKIVEQHRILFCFLWKLRRTEHLLSATWKLMMSYTRQISKIVPEVSGLLHRCHIIRQHMTNLISNIQYHMTFEVLDKIWHDMIQKIRFCSSLDELIALYSSCISKIIFSGIVSDYNESNQLNADSELDGTQVEHKASLRYLVWEIFEVVRDFDEQIKRLYETAQELALTRKKFNSSSTSSGHRSKAHTSVINPPWDSTSHQDNSFNEQMKEQPLLPLDEAEDDEKPDLNFQHLDKVFKVELQLIMDKYRQVACLFFNSLERRINDEPDHVNLRNLFQRINFKAH